MHQFYTITDSDRNNLDGCYYDQPSYGLGSNWTNSCARDQLKAKKLSRHLTNVQSEIQFIDNDCKAGICNHRKLINRQRSGWMDNLRQDSSTEAKYRPATTFPKQEFQEPIPYSFYIDT